LLETREIEFQDEASVERALFFYRSKKADFAECLHLGCAVIHDRLPLVTFDRQAAELEAQSFWKARRPFRRRLARHPPTARSPTPQIG
jgi:predicted nucleic-acid-binding protein